jgi:capsular polysaccharide transport system permease protein
MVNLNDQEWPKKHVQLYPDRQHPLLAIDADTFSSALAAGDLDLCLFFLQTNKENRADAAELNCRLAEALFHCGRRDEALACGERACGCANDRPHVLDFCAWLFSNCGRHGRAAGIYKQLVRLRADWVEGYRHASGSLAAIGEIDEAIAYGIKASDLAPHSAEFATHAGLLLLQAHRYEEAENYLQRALAAEPENASILRALSMAIASLGRDRESADVAVRAAMLAIDDGDTVIHAAELCQRCGRLDEAAELLTRAITANADDPRLRRVFSGIEMVRDRLASAISAIDRALAIAPDIAEYHLHRAHLLLQLHDHDGAARAAARAQALNPADPAVKRTILTVLLETGRITPATAMAGELLQDCPEDQEAAEAARQVLDRRLDTIDGDYTVVRERQLRPARGIRQIPGFLERLRTQHRVLRAVIIREARTRFADTKLGYGWALLEPILHLAMLSLTFSLLMHGRPPIGTEFFIFYYTRLIPYHVFVHASSAMTHAIADNTALLQLPLVTTFDVILARGAVEILTDALIAILLLIGFAAVGFKAIPDDAWQPVLAFIIAATLGCGIGFINAAANAFYKSWDKIYVQLMRALYFCSGIFYVPGMMPDWVRNILVWNPILHAIDWFRMGFYSAYQPHWLDLSYLVLLAILALLIGLTVERGLRRSMSQPA